MNTYMIVPEAELLRLKKVELLFTLLVLDADAERREEEAESELTH